MNDFSIDGRAIGPSHPVYVIAELSGNHNGSLERALATVHAAAQAGADAVKLQTYTPDTLTIDCDAPDFVVPGGGPWSGRKLYDLYKEAMTPWEWHPTIFTEARKLGLAAFSTPFDATAVDFLESLGAPAYKIASFEMVDDQLLLKVASTGKPVIISTGMASLEEVAHAVSVLEGAGASKVVLLKCTSSYPAPDDSMNLMTIPALAAATGKPIGLSDHSMGTTAPLVAALLGACLVEKHFTLSRADGGVDSHFSLEPGELRELVDALKRARRMLGSPQFGPGVAEEGSMVFRRSLYVVKDVRRGELLTSENVRSIRPGHGLPPRFIGQAIGSRACCDIKRGTPLEWKHFTG